MITLNLLPDIKKDYLKANRTKSIFVMVAFFVSAGAIAVVILVALYVLGVQKLQISNSQGSIDQSIKTLTETEDLDKVVTIQNQLEALPSLHEGTTAASRLFNYLKVITPNEVSLNSVQIDYVEYSVEIKGTGEDFRAVNTFVDILKNAGFTYKDSNGSTLAFSSVVLGAINADDTASFRVELNYTPEIFDPNIEGMKLSVPKITSTRSQTEKPKSLFDAEEEQK